MEFRTKINIAKSEINITHNDGIMLLGSCFTENIGHYLAKMCFPVSMNPFGIIYNPISIFNVVQCIYNHKTYTKADLLCHQELYFSLDHHGKFSGTVPEKVLEIINESVSTSAIKLENSNILIITLGSAFVYEYKKQQKIVANCHKLPGSEFNKRLLSVEEIKIAFYNIKNIVKEKKIIFTVSPVRHWRDGAVENLRSKSILIESIHQLVEENKNCYYFPAYEIMMDELRDYRFYSDDMLHPNETAIKYIWHRFSETFFNEETIAIHQFIEKGIALFSHRIKHDETKEGQLLGIQKNKFLEDLQQNYPSIYEQFQQTV